MSADKIIYCLENLTDYMGFERLCSALLAGCGYSEIDPMGGTGDEGRDAVILRSNQGEKVSFAYTVREDWKTKIAKDAKRVHDRGHGPDIFVFVCTETLTAREKDEAHRLITETYGWKLDLLDLERLRVQLVNTQRHLLAQHPTIFVPPFFPQLGGQSILESHDTILIDHVESDHALATWLARRLALNGYRTWCNGTAPLAGENVDQTIRALMKTRAALYVPVLSAASVMDEDFCDRCTIATDQGPSFAIPCNVEAVPEEKLPRKLRSVTPAHFSASWTGGLSQLLAKANSLGIEPMFDPRRGAKIALRDFMPTQVTTAKPEPVFANIFPLTLPKKLAVFQLSRELTRDEETRLRKQWAYVVLKDNFVASFSFPPVAEDFDFSTKLISDRGWSDVEFMHSRKTADTLKELVEKNFLLLCEEKGLKECQQRGVHYFPREIEHEWVQPIRHVDGRRTTVNLTGTATKGFGPKASPFAYHFSPKFRAQVDQNETWTLLVRIYIRVASLDGVPFQGKEIGRRRKQVGKNLWNRQWLARLLGVMQALETSEGQIEIGRGQRALIVDSQPMRWDCPVGLDYMALSGLSDLGEEIAGYRESSDDERDADENTNED